jgi:hypothetical protein
MLTVTNTNLTPRYQQNFGMNFKSLETIPDALIPEFIKLGEQVATKDLNVSFSEVDKKLLGFIHIKKIIFSVFKSEQNPTAVSSDIIVKSGSLRQLNETIFETYLSFLNHLKKNDGKAILNEIEKLHI